MNTRLSSAGFLVALCAVSAAAPGCALLLGLDEFTDQPPGAGGSGGSGGAGGAGGSDVPLCTPAAQEACYAGPAATEGVGECKAGIRTCPDDGAAWGACEGEVLPAVERCDATADENCDSLDCIVWATAFEQDGTFEPNAIIGDPSGNVIVSGFFTGAIDIAGQNESSAGSTDGLMIKLGPAGEVLWARKIGDLFEDAIAAVATDDAGNIFIAGRTATAIDFGAGVVPAGLYVAKLDPGGQTLWSVGLGGDGYFVDITLDSAGNAVVAGFFSEPIDFGEGPVSPAGGTDILVAKLDGENGAISPPGSWVRTVGDAGNQLALSVAVDGSDNVFVAGEFAGTIDFGGFGGQATANGVDGFLAKLTPAGSGSWLSRLGGAGEQQAFGVAVDAAGRPAVVGEFDGSIDLPGVTLTSAGTKDAFAIQFSATKDVVWSKAFGDAANQGARAAAMDSLGNLTLGGYAAGQIDLGAGPQPAVGDIDAFVAKLSPDGNPLWSRLLGGVEEDVTWALALSPSDEVLTANTSREEAPDFGTGPLPSSPLATRRLVIAKLGR